MLIVFWPISAAVLLALILLQLFHAWKISSRSKAWSGAVLFCALLQLAAVAVSVGIANSIHVPHDDGQMSMPEELITICTRLVSAEVFLVALSGVIIVITRNVMANKMSEAIR